MKRLGRVVSHVGGSLLQKSGLIFCCIFLCMAFSLNAAAATTTKTGAKPVRTGWSITATSGTPQRTIINTAFSSPFVVTVKNNGGNQVGAGVEVTFTAPSSGASGTFANGKNTMIALTDASGLASAALTANGTGGSYMVSATVLGVNTPAKFVLKNTLPYAIFSSGADTAVTTKSIDANGGTITIQNTGTPIDGITVSVPAGALNIQTTFSIGYNTGTLQLLSGTPSGVILSINSSGQTTFANPITITVPFNGDTSVIPVPYYIDTNGKLHLAQLVNVDRIAKTLTFMTFHASWYTWVYANMSGLATGFATAYSPVDDGFQVKNLPTTYSPGGVCEGMTAFSLWYYEHQKSSQGNFYPQYMEPVGANYVGQNIIASRAFISIAQMWFEYWPKVAFEATLTTNEKVVSIENALENTNNPVLLYLYTSAVTPLSAHSVLALGFAPPTSPSTTTTISIYDPNKPGNTNYLSFDKHTGMTLYDGFYNAIYEGDGSLKLAEPYDNILTDANLNFMNAAGATINVTSDTSGETVNAANVVLSGTIASSLLLVDDLTVIDDFMSPSFSTLVDLQGNFSMPITLHPGLNTLHFNTFGLDGNYNLDETPNNLWTTDFTINFFTAAANTTAQNLTVGTAMTNFSPFTTVTGGTPPYTYTSTPLPPGLSLDPTAGVVSGTPTAPYATANVVFSVQDANSVVASTTSTVSFTVTAASPNILVYTYTGLPLSCTGVSFSSPIYITAIIIIDINIDQTGGYTYVIKPSSTISLVEGTAILNQVHPNFSTAIAPNPGCGGTTGGDYCLNDAYPISGWIYGDGGVYLSFSNGIITGWDFGSSFDYDTSSTSIGVLSYFTSGIGATVIPDVDAIGVSCPGAPYPWNGCGQCTAPQQQWTLQ